MRKWSEETAIANLKIKVPFFLKRQKLINNFQASRALTTPNEDADDYQTFLSHFDINVYYAYSLVLQNKGQELGFKLASYSIHSQCRGLNCQATILKEIEILELIRDFKSLVVLNLSYNSLEGRIPSSLGNLRDLQLLDLSNNNLSGEIPPELRNMYYLAQILSIERHVRCD
ncbi:hypothetical protein Syun_002886 [Stephania yunnanensis]|uniref:Uncharacterized protein n=1 Tax=Stephania yunnanensis TaxID=152371 RepID=A0AAP0L3Z6_9MAGN